MYSMSSKKCELVITTSAMFSAELAGLKTPDGGEFEAAMAMRGAGLADGTRVYVVPKEEMELLTRELHRLECNNLEGRDDWHAGTADDEWRGGDNVIINVTKMSDEHLANSYEFALKRMRNGKKAAALAHEVDRRVADRRAALDSLGVRTSDLMQEIFKRLRAKGL